MSQSNDLPVLWTTASVIYQLEDTGYHGHSLSMLRRYTAALNRRVEIRFVPVAGSKQAAWSPTLPFRLTAEASPTRPSSAPVR